MAFWMRLTEMENLPKQAEHQQSSPSASPQQTQCDKLPLTPAASGCTFPTADTMLQLPPQLPLSALCFPTADTMLPGASHSFCLWLCFPHNRYNVTIASSTVWAVLLHSRYNVTSCLSCCLCCAFPQQIQCDNCLALWLYVLRFPTAGTMWPAASRYCSHALAPNKNCTLELWLSQNKPLLP